MPTNKVESHVGPIKAIWSVDVKFLLLVINAKNEKSPKLSEIDFLKYDQMDDCMATLLCMHVIDKHTK